MNAHERRKLKRIYKTLIKRLGESLAGLSNVGPVAIQGIQNFLATQPKPVEVEMVSERKPIIRQSDWFRE